MLKYVRLVGVGGVWSVGLVLVWGGGWWGGRGGVCWYGEGGEGGGGGGGGVDSVYVVCADTRVKGGCTTLQRIKGP